MPDLVFERSVQFFIRRLNGKNAFVIGVRTLSTKSLSNIRTVHSNIRTLRQKLDFFNFSSFCALERYIEAFEPQPSIFSFIVQMLVSLISLEFERQTQFLFFSSQHSNTGFALDWPFKRSVYFFLLLTFSFLFFLELF